jgi:uncharacterized protein YbjT (DUF2867 family)
VNVLILGAAGQIPGYLLPMLLEQTEANVVLYGRDVTRRVTITDATRVKAIDGSFDDARALAEAMQGIDVMYLNAVVRDVPEIEAIVDAMKTADIKKFIAASILAIYDEVGGEFGEWNKRMLGGNPANGSIREVADYIEASGLDYTILRLTWLYNQDGNYDYEITQKGEPFKGAQVTRQAVAQLVVDIINDADGEFAHTSIGVGEPNTDYEKPSFY